MNKLFYTTVKLRIRPILSKLYSTAKMTDNNPASQNASAERWFHKYEDVSNTPLNVFRGFKDRFNGITIDSNTEKCDEGKFDEMLENSLQFWEENNRRAIWFKISLKHADWVPALAKNKFNFHHAKESYVMMVRWLPKGADTNNIPVAPHVMVGVGALVVNDENQILVVSEKNALIENSWKLPGGYVEPNEYFIDAGIREVFEETSIRTKFETLLALRHAQGAGFGSSDLYIVMALKPETMVIQKCEREIAKCEWMDIQQYLEHPNVHQGNREFLQMYLDYKKNGIRMICKEEVHQILKRKYHMYSIVNDNDTQSSATSNAKL